MLQPELMDDPAIDQREHRSALRGLRVINRLSNAKGPIIRAIRNEVLREGLKSISILDVATGSGDLPIALGRALKASGVKAELHGCDLSETALAVGREESERAGIKVNFHQIDVLRDPIPQVDVVTCALFLHHLQEDDAVLLLERLSRAARRLLVLSDLRRCGSGLLLARIVPRLLTRSHVVHIDGVLSVQGAFTPSELDSLCTRAGLTGAQIRRIFPARMLLQWKFPA